MIAEIYGKVTGCAKGKGGSMHLIDIKSGIVAAVPIVGSTIPIGTGIAWGNKLKNNNKVVVVFGDGATEKVFFKKAWILHLYIILKSYLFVKTYYSVYSNFNSRQSKKRNILKLSESLG